MGKEHCYEIERCNQRGGRMLSVVDLIDAGTMNVELAAYLLGAVSSGSSFLAGAVPGGAGKTAVMCALLNFIPPDVRIVAASSGSVVRGASKRQAGPPACYLCHEIGAGRYFAYLWGRDARDFFNLTSAGHVVATNLHADTIGQTRDQLCGTNKVPEADFRRVNLMLFLRVVRAGGRIKRRIAAVYHSDGNEPHTFVYGWEPSSDAYVRTSSSTTSDSQALDHHKKFIESLCNADVRHIADVRTRVINHIETRG
jgi:hypothetical protein